MALRLLLTLLLLPGLAQADRIFQYRDAHGGVVFTDRGLDRVPANYTLLSVRKGWHPHHRHLTEAQRDAYDDDILYAAHSYDVDPALIKAVIHAESDFDPYAVSSAGAEGLMQLMPQTAGKLHIGNSFDPRQNILGGTRFLAYLKQRFSKLRNVIAAYNAGEKNVRSHGGIPPFPETQAYVKKVMQLFGRYRQQFSADDSVALTGTQ